MSLDRILMINSFWVCAYKCMAFGAALGQCAYDAADALGPDIAMQVVTEAVQAAVNLNKVDVAIYNARMSALRKLCGRDNALVGDKRRADVRW